MILEKIVVGPLEVNCYLIGCEKTCDAAIIDPGDEINVIIRALKRHEMKLRYILLTHGHVDHLTQLEKLKNSTQAHVFMHQADLFLLKNLSIQAAMFGLPDPGNPKPDSFVSGGDILTLGELKIKVLHTPGHSPGSVVYHSEDHLFVGDLIFSGSIGRTDLPGGDYEVLIRSVQQNIFTLKDEVNIHPGHGPATTVGQEKRFNPFFS